MFKSLNIHARLLWEKQNNLQLEEQLLREAKTILHQDLFTEKKILQNLRAYNDRKDLLNEDEIEKENIFHVKDIQTICVNYRLRFLNSEHYLSEIPYEAIAKIKQLSQNQYKNLKHFKILGSNESIHGKSTDELCLFCKTMDENYYLVHRWGKPYNWNRQILSWPLRKFETLFVTVALITLMIALVLPSGLITLDKSIGYFSGFRIAAFFHLLIFNFGVTAYITFAFNKNFSSSVWQQSTEF